jgi:hypothetical protein
MNMENTLATARVRLPDDSKRSGARQVNAPKALGRHPMRKQADVFRKSHAAHAASPPAVIAGPRSRLGGEDLAVLICSP